ncbi:hypothetical protein C8J57DRAFT_1293823 [Mycena rebaudengoi]|nr:hypothetical protein C8J57DRAFT_1293823 [Mycena rebaudengoi]
MHVLPVELLDAVCSYLDCRSDLRAVALTHSALLNSALRILYRTINVSTRCTPLSLVLTLASRPDLARHVRSFALSVDPTATLFHSFYRRLATALSHMTALVSLDLFIGTGSWVLPDAVYPQLQHFASSFPFDARVAKFISGVPALQRLQLEPSVVPAALQPEGMSRLAELVSCSSSAAAIVPGHPVESIHISAGDFTEDLALALAKSTAAVTVLSATTSAAPVHLLQILGQHLPQLIYLRITSTWNFPAAPTNLFYEQVAAALAFFPDLQSFELSGMYWTSSQKSDDQRRVWQSRPLSSESFVAQEEELLDLDLFVY